MVVYAVFFAFFGMIIGSFLNVLISRIPKGESIVTPRSHCPECGHYLKAWELIPVLSFLLLKGSCSNCRTRISLRYPGVEILTGLLFFTTVYFDSELTIVELLFVLIIISLLIALSFIDIETYRLPDVLVFPLLITGLVRSAMLGEPGLGKSTAGALAAAASFYLIVLLYPEGMGMGDVKFVGALGSVLGFPDVFTAIFIASLAGVLVGGLQIFLKKKNYKEPIPFGPFLAAGSIILLLSKDWLYTFFLR